MTDSLRDQLIGLGFKPAAKPAATPTAAPTSDPKRARSDHQTRRPDHQREPRPGNAAGTRAAPQKPGASQAPRPPGRPGPSRTRSQPASGQSKPRSREDIDLAKAYAIRAQREKDERLKAEQARQEEARMRREARAKLAELVKDKTLNDADADIARHFPYGDKIKRIHVTEPQLKALNAGELGVLQIDGRYVLVTAEVLALAEATFAPAVALKVGPEASAGDDRYVDPKYQVPDDLVW